MIPWGEKKESHLPISVFHGNRDITDPNIIANMYNDYFINIDKMYPQISMETYHTRII